RLPQPVRLLDDDARAGRQLPLALRLLGGGRAVLVSADRLLVHARLRRPGRQEGLHRNRVGDFGFGLAIMWIWIAFGTLDYVAVFKGAETLAPATATGIALLLFMGACGKSAQVPLHVWLPDAMEGPTPVSALIHAATMVTA